MGRLGPPGDNNPVLVVLGGNVVERGVKAGSGTKKQKSKLFKCKSAREAIQLQERLTKNL